MRQGLKVSGSSDILQAMEQVFFTRILVLRNATSESTRSLISRASELGIDVMKGLNDLRRMCDSSFNSTPSEALGLLKRDPSADLEDIMGLAVASGYLQGRNTRKHRIRYQNCRSQRRFCYICGLGIKL